MPVNLDRLRTGGALDGPLVRNALHASPPLRELAQGERVGPFRIEHELSRGGMGVVYLARRNDGEFEQRVALKWMSCTRDREVAEALFRRERDIVASLEHPGIARLIDGGREADGMLWFAMEYVEGQPVDAWCEERLLSVPRRVALVIELCDALAFAHQRLLIHRDIKPANVLVGADGRVKLLDFGIARLADQRDLLGNAAMTPGFASPEQWSGGEVTAASDVYQVGLLLARLLGVIGPLAEGTHATRIDGAAPMGAEPAALAAARLAPLGRELAAIVAQATAMAATARYGSVGALAEDLRRWRDQRPVQAVSGGWMYRSGCLLRRHPWVSTASAIFVAALLFLGWRLAIERDHARELAQRAIAAAARATAESTRAQASLRFVTGLLQWADPRNHGGEQVTVDAALARGASQLGGAEVAEPRLRAELLQLVGSLYLMREDVERAMPLLREARDTIAAIEAPDPILRARNAIDLALALEAQFDDEALALLAEVRALPPDLDGAAPLRVQAARHRAALVYRRGDLVGASAEMRAALDEIRAGEPDEAIEAIWIRNNLAGYVGDLGDHEAALALKRDNHAAALARYGESHPTTSLATTTLARTLLSLGRLDEARAFIEADGRVRARLWGGHHPQFGVHLQNMARLERRSGRLGEARSAILGAIAISRAGGEGGRSQLSSQLGDLADIELARGDAVAAEQAARESIDPALRRSAVVKDFGARLLTHVQALLALGRHDEVRAAMPRLAEEIAPLPQRHPRHALAALGAARLAAHDGDLAGARTHAARALALADGAFPSLDRELALAEARELLALLARAG
jgi:serine/threonine-protein kinase